MTNKIKRMLGRFAGAFLVATTLLCSGVILSTEAADISVQKTSTVSNEGIKNREVYTGGFPFGVKLYTDGLLVIGFSDVDCSTGSPTPAIDAGIQISDIIVGINGKKTSSAKEFIEIIEKSGGKTVTLEYMRKDTRIECKVTPSVSSSDGKYKTGMWLRDSTAGIGTVTFVVPDNGVFAGLGHGICDGETGTLVPLSRGITSGVVIGGIKKGVAGSPGELKGTFNGEKTGTLMSNTENGVFGIFTDVSSEKKEKIALGKKEDITEGNAYIICTLDDNKPGKYSVFISDIQYDSTGNKNFIVTITDKKLIEKTGGIVQGMSGSPIIQNGKLVGAVTHVLINDPTKGYGIFIDNMLKKM